MWSMQECEVFPNLVGSSINWEKSLQSKKFFRALPSDDVASYVHHSWCFVFESPIKYIICFGYYMKNIVNKVIYI